MPCQPQKRNQQSTHCNNTNRKIKIGFIEFLAISQIVYTFANFAIGDST